MPPEYVVPLSNMQYPYYTYSAQAQSASQTGQNVKEMKIKAYLIRSSRGEHPKMRYIET